MVCPGQRAPTTSRTVGVNEKPTQWCWSMGQNCASLGKKPRCWTNPMKGSTHTNGLTTRTAELHMQSLPSKINQDFTGKRSQCGRTTRMAVQELLETHKAQPHPGLVGRSLGELRRPSRNGTVRQRVRTGKKTTCRCPSDPRRGRSPDVLRHSGIKPMDNGNARGSRERKKRTTARRQSGESSRNQRDARLHATAKHASCTHHPDGFRCLRKVGRKGGTSAETSSKKKARKT